MVVRETMKTCCKVFIVSTDSTTIGLYNSDSDFAQSCVQIVAIYFSKSKFMQFYEKCLYLIVAMETMQ